MGARDYYPDYTYDDYAQWEGDWELIEGQAWAMAPSPSVGHQSISGDILALLLREMKACRHCRALMEVDYKVDDHTTLRPDVMVACRVDRNAPNVTQTPEVVFEVLSASTETKDRKVKYAIYEKQGVKYYLLVDPKNETVEVYVLREGSYVLEANARCVKTVLEFEECRVVFESDELWEEV